MPKYRARRLANNPIIRPSMDDRMGQIAGPLVAGVLADITGDYRTGFTVLALVAASGSVLFLLARKPLQPHR